jgi:hypothetical protein
MTMKGFVFTLDAIFSLVFAAFAVAALIYVSYSGYIPPSVQSTQVSSAAGTLLSMTVGQLGPASPLYGAGSTATWPQYAGSEGFSSGSTYGPTAPYLLYSYAATSNLIPAVVVSGGYVAFAAGNQIYELNATTGISARNYPVTNPNTIASSPLFYRNYLVYANVTGWVTAISTTNGLAKIWKKSPGYTTLSSPLELEDGYITIGGSNSVGSGNIYFIDPNNGAVAETDPSTTSGKGANVIWIAHHKGQFYVGAAGTFNSMTLHQEYVNSTLYPSNGFASYGNFSVTRTANNIAMFGNITSFYNKANGVLNITSIPVYAYSHSTSFTLPVATFNTTPSIGGNLTYLLSNGVNFYAFSQLGQTFNVTLPNPASRYNYSDVALAYGNAYVPNGNTLYVFGPGIVQSNSSLLATLGSLYLSGRGGLADSVLYSVYGAVNIGVFINGSYAPALHVATFNGVNNYIAIPAKAKLSPQSGTSGAMSLCGWYRINKLSQYNGLLFKGTQAPSSGNVPEFSIDTPYSATSGVAGRGFTIYSPSGNIAATYNTPLTSNAVGNWYSFCLSYNSTAAFYYLNGTQYTANVFSANVPGAGTGSLVIGAGTGGYSNVSVANIQLYNSVITSAKAAGIFNGGVYGGPANTSGLVGWWPLLGDGNDYSGSGLVGYPSNVMFTNANYIPASLRRAVLVGGTGVPLQLTNNGVAGLYNVSVAIWSS